MMSGKSFFRTLFFLLPKSRLKNWLLRISGVSVGKGAVIGPILVLSTDEINFGAGVKIGPLNVIWNLRKLVMEDHSRLGQWNWISASKPLIEAGGSGSLIVDQHSAITSRHYMDVSGGIVIGAFTTIAGVRSTFITHGIDWRENRQVFKPITIGSYCLISSNVNFAPGARLENKNVVAMGSTVAGTIKDQSKLVIQPRAKPDRALVGLYFERTKGYISDIESK